MSSPGPERRRRRPTADEVRLWRLVTRDVAPLPGQPPTADDDSAAMPAPPPSPAPSPAPPPPAPAPPPVARPKEPPRRLDHGQTPGVDRRTAERMRGGVMAIDGTIDLHGMTQDAAHRALTRFVHHAYDSGRRCLLVITGKGGRGPDFTMGVLRAQVPRWLNEPGVRGLVLGFSHAQPRDGGEGALYVLIKRRRP